MPASLISLGLLQLTERVFCNSASKIKVTSGMALVGGLRAMSGADFVHFGPSATAL